MADVGPLARLVAGARAWQAGAPSGVRVCRTAADLAGLAALDLVLVPGATEPVPAFLAAVALPAPAPPASAPGAIAWRRSRHWFWHAGGEANPWRPVR